MFRLNICDSTTAVYFLIFRKSFYLLYFLEWEGEGKRGEKHQCVVACHGPPLGTWPATQARALDWESNQ